MTRIINLTGVILLIFISVQYGLFHCSLKDGGSLIKTAHVWVDDLHKVCVKKPAKGDDY